MAKNKYRVTLQEKINDIFFDFAIVVKAKGLNEAESKAIIEFPNASIVKNEEKIYHSLWP